MLLKQLGGHCFIVAPKGSGLTTFLYGFAQQASTNGTGEPIVLFPSHTLLSAGQNLAASFYQEALASLPEAAVIIDNFGELLAAGPQATHIWTTLLRPLLTKKHTKLVLCLSPEELEKLKVEAKSFVEHFEQIKLEILPDTEILQILKAKTTKLAQGLCVKITDQTLNTLIKLAQRFPQLGSLPKVAISLLDESLTEAKTRAAKPTPHFPLLHYFVKPELHVSAELIEQLVSQKTGVPLARLSTDALAQLKSLEQELNQHVVGQQAALGTLSRVIQRAKLNLRAQNRPLGSFLMLGPSGVGKTETAKTLANVLYGNKESFLRLDMSEFAESHTVARLIGSPPGYLGFESGGQLTNHLQQQPYSLVLLDEIEKANAKIFDIFLQLLDDGRLTSGQGETVDATQSIVMATSNLAVDDILQAYNKGFDLQNQDAVKQVVFPTLLKHFRAEFLNRFDAILIYQPLSAQALTDIAFLEIKKIEQRTKAHNIHFRIDRSILEQKVNQLADPRFGARPVKRFVEELCEGLITKQLLK